MHFQDYINQLKDLLLSHLLIISDEKEISYGYQFKIKNSDPKDIVTLNAYYSLKKPGFRVLISAKADSLLKIRVEQILHQPAQPKNPLLIPAHWQTYGGCDEAGKGDFFGPLSAVCFIASAPQKDSLKKLGVQDSKNLNDQKIQEIAHTLMKDFKGQYHATILTPNQYNSLYTRFQQNGKNLNHLLAWMHARNISDISLKIKTDGFIIDKFNNNNLVKTSLKQMESIEIAEFHKAESDLIVASASILARYFFVKAILDMNERFKFNFPKGAGEPVSKARLSFIDQFGEEKLKEVAKIHFKMKK